jgi:DNA-binding transcriptional regulator GbsR (MarR family)
MTIPKTINPIIQHFIEDSGNMTQSFGLGRVVGQLYAYLYFSSTPLNLANMQDALGISKGSASTAVRQLEQWGAAKKVWVKGDRKDYYEACEWFGRVLKNAILDTFGKRMSSYTSLLDEVEDDLVALEGRGDGDGVFIRQRIDNLKQFQQTIRSIFENPIIMEMMK